MVQARRCLEHCLSAPRPLPQKLTKPDDYVVCIQSQKGVLSFKIVQASVASEIVPECAAAALSAAAGAAGQGHPAQRFAGPGHASHPSPSSSAAAPAALSCSGHCRLPHTQPLPSSLSIHVVILALRGVQVNSRGTGIRLMVQGNSSINVGEDPDIICECD